MADTLGDGGVLGATIRERLVERLLPFDPPIDPDADVGAVRELVASAREEAGRIEVPEEAVGAAWLLRARYSDTEDPAERLALYHRIAAMANRAVDLHVRAREEDFRAADALDGVLWDQLLLWELAGAGTGLLYGCSAIAAENLLIERHGVEIYLEAREDRRRRSANCLTTLRRVWRGTRGTHHPVFCTHCHELIGDSLQEAVERTGAETGPLGPWAQCPHCEKPTVLRA